METIFSEIKNDILKLKIKKVCLVELKGVIPNENSLITLNERNELDGKINIDGKEYFFIKNKFINL